MIREDEPIIERKDLTPSQRNAFRDEMTFLREVAGIGAYEVMSPGNFPSLPRGLVLRFRLGTLQAVLQGLDDLSARADSQPASDGYARLMTALVEEKRATEQQMLPIAGPIDKDAIRQHTPIHITAAENTLLGLGVGLGWPELLTSSNLPFLRAGSDTGRSRLVGLTALSGSSIADQITAASRAGGAVGFDVNGSAKSHRGVIPGLDEAPEVIKGAKERIGSPPGVSR